MRLLPAFDFFRMMVSVMLFSFISYHSAAQDLFCDSIVWSASRPLAWKDFRGEPDPTSRIGALSHISFRYKLEQDKRKIRLQTVAYFQPCTSWVDSSSGSSLSLEHEQTHFNIDELVRRVFVDDILNIAFDEKKLIRNIQHLYFVAMLSRQLMHDMYDKETDYHRNATQQVLWNEKLLQMLHQKDSCSSATYEWNVSD